MFGRKTLIAAGLVYLVVIACTLWPGSTPVSTPTADAAEATSSRLASLNGLPYCGASMQLHDPNGLAGYEKACDEIAAQGGDSVMFVPAAYQENGGSRVMYIDERHALSFSDLTKLIIHARAEKLRVILMPIVLLDRPRSDTEWRGTIHPEGVDGKDGWDDWFDSYRDMMMHYATIARDTDVNLLVVGSELVSAEPFVDEWHNTIRQIRGAYKGQLTYSSNWDHYMMVQFWNDLDIVGMNSYWNLGPDDDPKVPVDEINRRWAAIQKDLFAWQATVHKPIILLEAGWCSLANASYRSWDYTQTELPVDLDLQKRLYEGFFQSWWGKPQFAGFLMWEWTPESAGGPEDKGYTPRGKPAADVMKEWFAKQRWKVQ